MFHVAGFIDNPKLVTGSVPKPFLGFEIEAFRDFLSINFWVAFCSGISKGLIIVAGNLFLRFSCQECTGVHVRTFGIMFLPWPIGLFWSSNSA